VRVSLQTRGGLAAPINRNLPPTVVDTAALPPGKAAELARLVDAVIPAASPASSPASSPDEAGDAGGVRGGDMMSYTIVVDDGPRLTTLTRSDGTMSPEFADLLDWIQDHAP